MPGWILNACPHGNHVTMCPDCRRVDPIVTTPRELAWMKAHLPDHYRIAVRAVSEGKAIITQEAPGCRAF